MKIITITALILNIIGYSQTVESTIKTICHCQPISHFNEIRNNKLFFTTLEENQESFPNFYMNVYERTGNRWFKELKYNIENQSDFVELIKSENSIKIDDVEYFISIYNIANNGTAYNGRSKNMFVFQNINNPTSTTVIYFEIWAGDNNGEYTVKNETNIIPFKNFIIKSSEFIEKIYGPSNDDIDSKENFHIKWKIENNNIYNLIENENQNISFNPTEFKGKEFYDEHFSEEIKNTKYLASGGFSAPIIIYDVVKNVSKVIFIPEGWPNGAMWGFRSFYLKNINGNILTVESSDYSLKIDLSNNKISAKKIEN